MKKFIFYTLILLFSLLSVLPASAQNPSKEDWIDKQFKKAQKSNARKMIGHITVIEDKDKVEALKKEIKSKRIEDKTAKEKEERVNKGLATRFCEGEHELLSRIVYILKTGEEDRLSSILWQLPNCTDEKAMEILRKDTAFTSQIIALLDNEDVEIRAASTILYLELDNAVEVLEHHLISGSSKMEVDLFHELSNDGTSELSLDYFSELVDSSKIEEDNAYRFFSSLNNFGDNGDDAMKAKVGALALKAFRKNVVPREKLVEDGTYFYEFGLANEVLAPIVKYADEDALKLFKNLYNADVGKRNALYGLLRLQGEAHKDKVFEIISENLGQSQEIVKVYYKAHNDQEVVDSLIQAFGKTDPAKYEFRNFVETFYDMGLQDQLDSVPNHFEDSSYLDPYNQYLFLYRLTKEQIQDSLLNFNLISAPMQLDSIEIEEPLSTFYMTMSESNIYLSMDSESYDYPIDYPNLLASFAENSKGVLDDMLVSMDAELNEEYYSATYKLTVVFKDKAYISYPEDLGETYDLDVVIQLLHKILKDNGYEERFHEFGEDEYWIEYIFGKKAVVNKFKKIFNYQYEEY